MLRLAASEKGVSRKKGERTVGDACPYNIENKRRKNK